MQLHIDLNEQMQQNLYRTLKKKLIYCLLKLKCQVIYRFLAKKHDSPLLL